MLLLVGWLLIIPHLRAQPAHLREALIPPVPAVGSRVQGPGDEHWQDGFDDPNFLGGAQALTLAANGDLIVGGNFAHISWMPGTLHVARWTGRRWLPIGTGISDPVTNLLTLRNGDLVAVANNSTANTFSLIRWNGTLWRQFTTLNGAVTKLVETANGDLLVAGRFQDAGGNLWADYLARWDGAAWQSVGGTALNGAVNDVVLLPSGQFIVGGEFTDAGGALTADYLARWDGAQWQPLGNGAPAKVSQIEPAANGDLLAVWYPSATSSEAELHRFNGTNWQPMYGPLPTGGVADLVVKPNGDLVVGGGFRFGGSIANSAGVIQWDGTSWQKIGQQRLLPGTAGVTQLLLKPSGDIVAGGGFMVFPGAWRSLVEFDGTNWKPFGKGIAASFGIGCVVTGPGGEPYVGGSFSVAADPAAHSVARWTGSEWRSLGTELNQYQGVTALAWTPTRDLLAVAYWGAYPNDTTGVFRWNGASWQPVGAPVLGVGVSLSVGPTGDMLLAGWYRTTTTVSGFVSRWNGTAWQSFGPTLNGSVDVVRHAPNGDIVAGGMFTAAGGNANASHIARWDGSAWQAYGTGLDSAVYALAWRPNGDLVAAGKFKNAGGNAAADYVARWDGAAWQPLGPGLNKVAWAVTVAVNGDVIVGGEFTDAGGNPNADRIARWDGTAWQPMGTGLNGPPYALAMGPADAVYVAGSFTAVGDGSMPTRNFAIYNTHLVGMADEAPAGTALHLFPNPAHATVRLSGATAPTATILDVCGRIVRTADLSPQNSSLSLQGLPPGLYLVRVGAQVRRLVVE